MIAGKPEGKKSSMPSAPIPCRWEQDLAGCQRRDCKFSHLRSKALQKGDATTMGQAAAKPEDQPPPAAPHILEGNKTVRTTLTVVSGLGETRLTAGTEALIQAVKGTLESILNTEGRHVEVTV